KESVKSRNRLRSAAYRWGARRSRPQKATHRTFGMRPGSKQFGTATGSTACWIANERMEARNGEAAGRQQWEHEGERAGSSNATRHLGWAIMRPSGWAGETRAARGSAAVGGRGEW